MSTILCFRILLLTLLLPYSDQNAHKYYQFMKRINFIEAKMTLINDQYFHKNLKTDNIKHAVLNLIY